MKKFSIPFLSICICCVLAPLAEAQSLEQRVATLESVTAKLVTVATRQQDRIEAIEGKLDSLLNRSQSPPLVTKAGCCATGCGPNCPVDCGPACPVGFQPASNGMIAIQHDGSPPAAPPGFVLVRTVQNQQGQVIQSNYTPSQPTQAMYQPQAYPQFMTPQMQMRAGSCANGQCGK